MVNWLRQGGHKELPPFSQNLVVLLACPPPLFNAGTFVWLHFVQVLCLLSKSLSSFVQLLCPENCVSWKLRTTSSSDNIPSPYPWRMSSMYVPFRMEHFTVSCLPFMSLGVFVNCHLLQGEVSLKRIDKSGVTLILCLLSIIIVLVSTLGPLTYLSTGSCTH